MKQARQLFRFLVTGAWNTFFGLVLFYFLLRTGLNYQIVLLCSFTIASAQSHFTQRTFVWKSSQAYHRELIRFYAGTIGFYVLNALLLPLLVEVFNLDLFVSQCIVTFFLTIFSFWFQKKIVFFQDKNSVD
jgi:putative flippase GtrA